MAWVDDSGGLLSTTTLGAREAAFLVHPNH
jgi:hypothetical protein